MTETYGRTIAQLAAVGGIGVGEAREFRDRQRFGTTRAVEPAAVERRRPAQDGDGAAA